MFFFSAWRLYLVTAGCVLLADAQNASSPSSCTEWSGSSCGWEPNLKSMEVDFGLPEKETFYAFVTPDVATFYNNTAGAMRETKDNFRGMFGKFINLSPDTIHVFWDGGRDPVYMSTVAPFDSSGTATYVGHKFIVTKNTRGEGTPLVEWNMEQDNCLYYYDPYGFNIKNAHAALDSQQVELYHMQLMNKVFAEQYKKFTGRDWLALYKQKFPPRWHMWRADAIGQTYSITTKEIYFEKLPDETELQRGTSVYGPRPDERERMRRLRARESTLNLTMTVLSCAPRVFEIKNFLSDAEVEHVLNTGKKRRLQKSSVQAGGASEAVSNSDTRTSTNGWINRNQDLVIDAIYARAADVLQMNESLLRTRRETEIPEFTESHVSVAERLQLVNYQVGQQYTPHHDFMMPGLVNLQPSRFATILFYLNDDMEGGETAFPKWTHADGKQGALKVKPEKGKAVLFYNVLPDGNYDELSQHAALPVTKGEKWLTNLWVWDPVRDHTSDMA